MTVMPLTPDDGSRLRARLSVATRDDANAVSRRVDWKLRTWGIAVSTVVHGIAFGLAALIWIQPKSAEVAAYLDSKWSTVETPVVDVETTVEEPTRSDEPNSTPVPGGSSLAELLDLALNASSGDVSVLREVTPNTTLVEATLRRASPRTKRRSSGTANPGARNATVGQGLGEGNAIGDGRGFFGPLPQGKSIVFVVDNSRSMNHKHDSPAKTRYRRVKFELVKSIMEMSAESQFFVIFFSNETLPMPATDLQPATPEVKDRYLRWLVQVDTGGGPTDPRGAMQAALRLQPDLIYFLTDGEFERGVNLKLMSIEQPRTMIHTFAFGEQVGESVLKTIARKNRGEYKFIP